MPALKNRVTKSIKGKILLYTGSIMFLVLGLVIAMYSRDMYLSLLDTTQKHITLDVSKAALDLENGNTEIISTLKAMSLAQENGMFGMRSETIQYLYATLYNNPTYFDAYIIYEPDADGQDANYKGQPCCDPTGRYNALVINQKGKYVQSNGVNMETSLFYQGLKDKVLSGSEEKYMITEPYVYEGVMMIEQTYPIFIKSKFAGITGVDRTLSHMSEYLASLKPYKTADFILISGRGAIIAATMDASLNTKKIDDTPYKDIFNQYYKKDGISKLIKAFDPLYDDHYFYVGAHVKTGDWTLVMRVGEDEILLPIQKTVISITFLAVAGLLVTFLVLLRVSNSIANPVRISVKAAERIAAGDLTTQIDSASDDEAGLLLNAIHSMTEGLNSLVGQVQRSCIQVTTSATQIAASARQLEATVAEQAASLTQVSTTANEISMTSQELANTMGDVTERASQTAVLADSGRNSLTHMAGRMEILVDATDSVSSKLAVITEKANNINRIITTITKVADQTNLLSLNAAIEAEKAGEMGLGFAVVAREIRRLADQTAVATLDIEKMVKEMQAAVSAGVMEMDKFSENVRSGIKAVDSIGTQLEQIMNQVKGLTPRFAAVNDGMQSQSQAALQISEAMGQLSEAAQQTSESVSEFNQATEQLREAARDLKEEVSHFKIRS